MKRPPSAYAKVAATMLGAIATALAATLPNTTAGKWAAVVVAVLVAMGLVERTRNTEIVATGDEQGPVTLGQVLDDSGEVVGEVVATTGAAAGGVIEGTTGVVGKVLDGTLGRLIPGGGDGGRHAA